MSLIDSTIICEDENIDELRHRHPDGLTFVVGDLHGESGTLQKLMEKIKLDPSKDHVYFVGDYNGGGDVETLLEYMAEYYEADCSLPGFHMIRGNHEHELYPIYPLEKLPNVIVIRGRQLNYYIVHAGMQLPVFDLINSDMAGAPERRIFSYKLDDKCVEYNAPFRQMIWSRYGLYSQGSHSQNWPDEASLIKNRACIIHGHSPYCFFIENDRITYGDRSLYWQNQHIFFSEDLQSFNIDSNVKGRYENGEGYRALSCVCIEGIEEVAKSYNGYLTTVGVKNAPSFVFSVACDETMYRGRKTDIGRITEATPEARLITLDENKNPIFAELK